MFIEMMVSSVPCSGEPSLGPLAVYAEEKDQLLWGCWTGNHLWGFLCRKERVNRIVGLKGSREIKAKVRRGQKRGTHTCDSFFLCVTIPGSKGFVVVVVVFYRIQVSEPKSFHTSSCF